MSIKKRNYKREYALFHGKKKEIKRRAQRNKARRLMVKKGKAHKGDGKDVHHKDRNTKNCSLGNLAVIAKEKNRSIK